MKTIFEATILGNPMVKKNSQKVAIRGRRPIKYNTPQYTAWHKTAVTQLWQYKDRPRGLDEPLILKCLFYMQTNRRVDLSALYEGIQDILVEIGVIEDDYFKIIIGHDGSRVLVDPKNPRLEFQLITQ